MKESAGVFAACFTQLGCIVIIVLFNATIGGLALNYALSSIVGKTVPALAAGAIGLFFGEVTVPLAIGCWVARAVGVHVPFVH
jgi:hypothetical protein